MSEHFGAVDYVVFIAMLMISTAIGLYYAWKDRKTTNEDEFLRGYSFKQFPNCEHYFKQMCIFAN